MGQKVNPHGLRVGVIKGWNTQWYADKKEFSKYLKEDNVIRTFLKKKYYAAAISKITIERAATRIIVTIFTARPGVIIGKAGAEVENIKKDLAKLTGGKAVSVNITEVKKPDCDAQLVAESVAAHCGGGQTPVHLIWLNGRHGTGSVIFLHRTITDYDNLVQYFRIFL